MFTLLFPCSCKLPYTTLSAGRKCGEGNEAIVVTQSPQNLPTPHLLTYHCHAPCSGEWTRLLWYQSVRGDKDGGYQFQYLDGVFLAGRGERRVCFYEDPQYYPSLCFHSLLPLPMMPAPNPIDNFLWLKLSTLLDLIDHSHILEIFSSLGFFFTDFFSHSSDQPPQICLHLGHLPKLQSHIFRCQFHFFSRIV